MPGKEEDILRVAGAAIAEEARAVRGLAGQLGEEFMQAVKAVHACRGRVLVAGVGAAGHIARKIAGTLAGCGVPACFLDPSDAAHGELGAVTSQDVVLVLSVAGQAPELLRLGPALAATGATVVAMMGSPLAPLGRQATITVPVRVDKEADPLGLLPTASSTALLVMGDALALAVAHLRQVTREDVLRLHPAGDLRPAEEA